MGEVCFWLLVLANSLLSELGELLLCGSCDLDQVDLSSALFFGARPIEEELEHVCSARDVLCAKAGFHEVARAAVCSRARLFEVR